MSRHFPEETPSNWARRLTSEINVSINEAIEAGRDLLDEQRAAAVLTVSPGTLRVWRSTGRYNLPFLRIGRNVRYRRADLIAWLDTRVSGVPSIDSIARS
jgi:hypothetical protein